MSRAMRKSYMWELGHGACEDDMDGGDVLGCVARWSSMEGKEMIGGLRGLLPKTDVQQDCEEDAGESRSSHNIGM